MDLLFLLSRPTWGLSSAYCPAFGPFPQPNPTQPIPAQNRDRFQHFRSDFNYFRAVVEICIQADGTHELIFGYWPYLADTTIDAVHVWP